MDFKFAVPVWETNTIAVNSSKYLFKTIPQDNKKNNTKQGSNKVQKKTLKRRLGKQLKTTSRVQDIETNMQPSGNRKNSKPIKSDPRSELPRNKQTRLKASKQKRHVVLKNPENDQKLQKPKMKLKRNKTFQNASSKSEVTTPIVSSIKKKQITKNNTRKLRQLLNTVFKDKPSNNLNMSLRERMLNKLMGARFRFLNEQLYTSKGNEAMQYFKQNPQDYVAYHKGYSHQVSKWPLNPVDIIIKEVRKMPNNSIIADFGCGEAKLAQSVPHKVFSFDLAAVNKHVTVCNMAHVPLGNSSADVAVFCLSLMGTNLKDYILEANRVLKIGGVLKIAEVESRIDDVNDFISNIEQFGFIKKKKNLSYNLFCFMDFTKKEIVKQKKLLNLELSPCLYKKR